METIRSRGKINIIDNIPRGKGSAIAKEFLDKVARGFVKYSSNYMDLVHESPFAFRERQLSSIFAPALAELSDAFLMEIPTNRKDKKLKYDSHGWIDYWASYNSIDFFLELKHSFVSYFGGIITKSTSRRWQRANHQTKDCIHSLIKLEASKGFMILPIQVITIYETVKFDKESSGVNNIEALISIQSSFYENLNPKVNWSCLWIIHEDLANKSHDVTEKSNKFFPAVLIVANVSELNS